jgi:hypothetical protein
VDIDGTTALTAISCPTTALCVAADVNGAVLFSTNPAGGAGAWTTRAIDSNAASNALTALACPVTTLCETVDAGGEILSSPRPTGTVLAWSSATPAAPEGSQGVEFTSIACSGTQLCVAGDAAGDTYITYNPTSLASADWTPLTQDAYPIDAISCPSSTECALVDGWGGVMFALPPQALLSSVGGSGGSGGGGSGGGGASGGSGGKGGTGSGGTGGGRTTGKTGAGDTVEVTIRCRLRHGRCHVTAAVSTVEVLRRGHVVAVAASGHRRDDRTVVLGRKTATIRARKRAVITVKLSKRGVRLLDARHALPAELRVVERDPRRTLEHRRIELRQPSA